jgi:hypothetical protein
LETRPLPAKLIPQKCRNREFPGGIFSPKKPLNIPNPALHWNGVSLPEFKKIARRPVPVPMGIQGEIIPYDP